MPRLSFRPPTWAWLLAPLALAATLALAHWQLTRGDAKRELQQRYLAAATAEPAPLDARSVATPGAVVAGIARGRFLAERQLLLDNQSHAHRPGYHVWTPLALDSGGLVLVNRGWVAQGADRATPPALPAPEGVVEVRGLWRALPEPGLRVAADHCAGGSWPRIVQYPRAEDLACLFPPPLAHGILLLDPAAPGGFLRDWQLTPDMPPEKHYAYATQWLAFALLILILFVSLNLKKRP